MIHIHTVPIITTIVVARYAIIVLVLCDSLGMGMLLMCCMVGVLLLLVMVLLLMHPRWLCLLIPFLMGKDVLP